MITGRLAWGERVQVRSSLVGWLKAMVVRSWDTRPRDQRLLLSNVFGVIDVSDDEILVIVEED